MRVAITGGAGFIGANLARLLSAQGAAVVAVDDLSTGSPASLEGTDVDLIEGSILDRPVLDQAFQQVDAVVHLAARPSVPRSLADPVASHLVNATGTVEVLEGVRRAASDGRPPPHLVVASSSSVYGSNPTLPKHESLAARPVSPYAASKLATEAYALAWAASYGLDVLAVRFFNVFGPLQAAGHAYAAVIPAFVDAAMRDEALLIHGDGTQSRDFTYVGSVCNLLADALTRRVAAPEPVNLAFGTRISLLEVVQHLEAELGHPLSVDHRPPRPGDVRHSQADPATMRRLFPTVDAVPFAEGLSTTVAWFRGECRQPG